jgi:cysteinyl-tRNA synthetase
MANVWMHNGFLQVEGEKMSKSAGNFVTIRELLESDVDGSAIRLAMLMTQYRQPVDWTRQRLTEAEERYKDWLELVGDLPAPCAESKPSAKIIHHLFEDLNTPEALNELYSLEREAKSDDGKRVELLGNLVFFGFFPDRDQVPKVYDKLRSAIFDQQMRYRRLMDDFSQRLKVAQKYANSGRLTVGNFRTVFRNIESSKLNEMIEARLEARAARNWAESDRIRDELAAMGIALKDNKDGTTTWEVAR